MVAFALSSLISIVLLLFLYFRLYRQTALEVYRNNLFRLRAQVFDLVHESDDLNFDSDVYKHFEQFLNNNIRYAHNVSFLNVMIFMAIKLFRFPGWVIQSTISVKLGQSLRELPEGAEKARLVRIRRQFDAEIIRYLVKTSPVFTGYVVVLGFTFWVRKHLRMSDAKEAIFAYFTRHVGKRIDYQAETYCIA